MCQWYGLHFDTWDAGELGEVQRFYCQSLALRFLRCVTESWWGALWRFVIAQSDKSPCASEFWWGSPWCASLAVNGFCRLNLCGELLGALRCPSIR